MAEAQDATAAYDALCALTKATVGTKLFTVMTADMDAMLACRTYTDDPQNYPTTGTKEIEMNRWFERAIEANPPPAPGGKRIKPRYVTQAKTRPPSFILFGTRVDLLPQSYERYLVNSMRKEFGFGAVPVRLTMRPSKNPFDKD